MNKKQRLLVYSARAAAVTLPILAARIHWRPPWWEVPARYVYSTVSGPPSLTIQLTMPALISVALLWTVLFFLTRAEYHRLTDRPPVFEDESLVDCTPRRVPVLLEHLRVSTYWNRADARRALTVALTQMEDQPVALLPDDRQLLRSELLHFALNRAPEYACAILTALEAQGDTRYLDDVHFVYDLARDERVKETAKHCMEVLAALADEERNYRSLLRPSTSADEAVLLRVAGAGGGPPEQLLRPAAGAHKED